MGFSRVFDLLQEMTQQLWAGEKNKGSVDLMLQFLVDLGVGGSFNFFFFFWRGA